MDVRYSKYRDMTSAGENDLNITTNASLKMGHDQVSRE